MGVRIEFEYETPWRKVVTKAHPSAVIGVQGRRENRDNLSARVNGIEVGQFRRADDDPPGGWVELPPGFPLEEMCQ